MYNLDGASDIYQGITTNFRSIANNRDGDVSVQGQGIADGTFADGNIAAAYRPDFRVIYLGGSYCWGTELDTQNCPTGDSLFYCEWWHQLSVSTNTKPFKGQSGTR